MIDLYDKEVLCRSDKEALKILEIAEAQNYRWIDGQKPITYWPDMYPAILYFDKFVKNSISYDYTTERNIKIHPEYIATSDLLERGDKNEQK